MVEIRSTDHPPQAPRFPLPGIPTTFETYIVGPSLRADDSENGFTADMCVPIFPNTTHPNNRPSVRTKTPFPFSNCYHWAYVDVMLRVPSGEFPGLDDPRLVRLAASEQGRLDRHLTKDLTAAVFAKRERQRTSPQPDYDPEEDVFARRSKVPEELLPVVTVSVDLAGSLEETDLPDPVEFLRQYNALIRYAHHIGGCLNLCLSDHGRIALPKSRMRGGKRWLTTVQWMMMRSLFCQRTPITTCS